ncbi:MAG: hypothetical protein JSW27_03140 [Phycisphaerales bacterium]|nr:MAG: hypothetical protein JSW27_03140 [Phycisphaerales bacterium]
MATDWKTLESKTENYLALTQVTDPVSGLITVTFCGLRTSMSEVLKGLPDGGAFSTAVFADSLVIDVPTVKGTGLIVMAREVDITALNGNPLALDLTADGDGVAQFMIGGTIGGTFTVVGSDKQATVVTPPVGVRPLDTVVYSQSKSTGALTVVSSGDIRSVQDLIGQSWSLNSLMSGYAAAAWLMDNTAQQERATAQAILSWVVACAGSLAADGGTMPSDYAQLYNQAAALLVTLNVAPGVTFVPILSGDVYSSKMNKLIDLLQAYENNMSTLETQQDIAKAIATVSAGLKQTAGFEALPLQVQLNNIKTNLDSLREDIRELRGDFLIQAQATDTAYNVLQTYISLKKIKDQLDAELQLALSVMDTGFDVMKVIEGDCGALKDAINDGVTSITNAITVIEGFGGGGGSGTSDLGNRAIALLQSQSALMNAFLNGTILHADAHQQQSGQTLPTNPAAITIDPVTDWNNYLAAAEAQINPLKKDGGSAAETLLANVKILVGYGKAISGKYVAYVEKLVQATVVTAQIKASQDVEKNWQDIEAQAKSDEQKLAALKALVLSRANAAKRSIYVSWTYYAASYFYLNFQTPKPALRMDMDSSAIKAALVGVADWVEAALGNAPDGKHIKLPSTNADIELDFDILQPDTTQAVGGEAAKLSKTDQKGWTLLWTITLGTPQLEGVLPNGGKCAIWISEASFFLDGVTPNSKGNVISTVATAGTYENGFGPADSHTFATKGLSGNYLYTVADSHVYSPWQIDTAVYMTPTPYTQWTMTLPPDGGDPSTASKLRVKLKIAYMTPN